MADSTTRELEEARARASSDFERKTARRLRRFLPLAAIALGLLAFFVKGLAFAILVLTAGALLFAIFELWWSLRTLAGDAPIETEFLTESLASNVVALEEQKRAVLRTLKDLEHERSIGRLTDADFEELSATYREEAKDVLRKLDAVAGGDEAAMNEAEWLVGNRLEKISRANAPDNSDVWFAQDVSEKVSAAKRRSSEAKEAAAAKASEGGLPAAGNDSADDITADNATGDDPLPPSPITIGEKALDEKALSEREQRAAKTTRTCTSCATVNDTDAAFCKKCGKAIGAHVE